MVRALAIYSDHPSSNPADDYSFSVNWCLKRRKISKERSGLVHFIKTLLDFGFLVVSMLAFCNDFHRRFYSVNLFEKNQKVHFKTTEIFQF